MPSPLNILLVEPFLGGSHAAWAHGFAKHSRHKVQVLGLPARHWKWRMHGGAVTLAGKFDLLIKPRPDLMLATDMLDLGTFLSLTRARSHQIPVALYFHENQLTYPWSPTDADVPLQRDNHYAFINYTSALAADRVFFNSQYHHDSFLGALPAFLRSFPDKRNHPTIAEIKSKSRVLRLGMDLKVTLGALGELEEGTKLSSEGEQLLKDAPYENSASGHGPLLLWNHRWEYDKGPEDFFQTLIELQEEGLPFRLAVLGQSYGKVPPVFERARTLLADRIVQWGYSLSGYYSWLEKADCLPVTSNQDFFGGSVVEAIYYNCWPLLPDRLAYPEHIPREFKSQVLYPEGGFKVALRNFIQGFVARASDGGIDLGDAAVVQTRPWVQHYDWEIMAPLYDAALAKMLPKG